MVNSETQWVEVNGRWKRIPVTSNTNLNSGSIREKGKKNSDNSPSSREAKQKPETVKQKYNQTSSKGKAETVKQNNIAKSHSLIRSRTPPPLPRRNRNNHSSPKKIERNTESKERNSSTSNSKHSSPPPGISKTNSDEHNGQVHSSPKKPELDGKSKNRSKSTSESKYPSPPPGISKTSSVEYNGLVQNGTRRFSTNTSPMKGTNVVRMNQSQTK